MNIKNDMGREKVVQRINNKTKTHGNMSSEVSPSKTGRNLWPLRWLNSYSLSISAENWCSLASFCRGIKLSGKIIGK